MQHLSHHIFVRRFIIAPFAAVAILCSPSIFAEAIEAEAPPSTTEAPNIILAPTEKPKPAPEVKAEASPFDAEEIPAEPATPPGPPELAQPAQPMTPEIPKAEKIAKPKIQPSEGTDSNSLQEVQARGYRVKEGTKYIDNPLSERGLIKIEKSGAYIYQTTPSPIDSSFSFRVGTFDPTNLENPDIPVAFSGIYDPSSGPILFGDYEFRFLKSLGKMGLKIGTGLFTTSGKGIFEDSKEKAMESFTFIAIPFNAGLIYRLQLWEKQPLVPYGEAGVMAIGFTEIRDDGETPKIGGSTGFYFAGGVQLDMAIFGTDEMMDLDTEWGINRMWLVAELRAQTTLGKYDFTGNIINGGFLFEY